MLRPPHPKRDRACRLELRYHRFCPFPSCAVRVYLNSSEAVIHIVTCIRFSVKEVAYKAMYPDIRPTWKELSYSGFGSQFPGSKPHLSYEPDVHSLRGKIGQLHVSVSHDGEYVVSTVLVEAPQQ